MTLSYLMLDEEPSAQSLADLYFWANAQDLQNPRVISPALLNWSSVFNPLFFSAATRGRDGASKSREPQVCRFETLSNLSTQIEFWLQSVLFLGAVTMSAAIIQSRWSRGTIGSKYDKLWRTGCLSRKGIFPQLESFSLVDRVNELATSENISPVDRLLRLRGLFELAIAGMGQSIHAQSVTMTATNLDSRDKDRFGFVDTLTGALPSVVAIVVYGSSINSLQFADYDIVLVSDDPETVLRKLAGTSPTWNHKELNIGVYSPGELWNMQLLAGDNLADYGLCVYGEIDVPEKEVDELLARNMSFGLVRTRQQIGMTGTALASKEGSDLLDRNALYEYFVKIPGNIAKGTFGAIGDRLPKEVVHEWLMRNVGFDTNFQQSRVRRGESGLALCEATAATSKVLQLLNSQFGILTPCDLQSTVEGRQAC